MLFKESKSKKMKCNWCNNKEVEFQLVVYTLKKEQTSIIANHREKRDQYLRDKHYVSVNLCGNCVPVTHTTNLKRYKLRGYEKKGG